MRARVRETGSRTRRRIQARAARHTGCFSSAVLLVRLAAACRPGGAGEREATALTATATKRWNPSSIDSGSTHRGHRSYTSSSRSRPTWNHGPRPRTRSSLSPGQSAKSGDPGIHPCSCSRSMLRG